MTDEKAVGQNEIRLTIREPSGRDGAGGGRAERHAGCRGGPAMRGSAL